jgi:GDP-D-mannose dehydratase
MCSLPLLPFKVQPDEIYSLAGQSSVSLSFERSVETQESIYVGTLNLLEAIRFAGKAIKLYNASSSVCFGDLGCKPATGWWSRPRGTGDQPSNGFFQLSSVNLAKSRIGEDRMGLAQRYAKEKEEFEFQRKGKRQNEKWRSFSPRSEKVVRSLLRRLKRARIAIDNTEDRKGHKGILSDGTPARISLFSASFAAFCVFVLLEIRATWNC